MSSDRPKLGDAFRAPDRTAGLAGLLPPPAAPDPEQPIDDQPVDTQPDNDTAPPTSTTAPDTPPKVETAAQSPASATPATATPRVEQPIADPSGTDTTGETPQPDKPTRARRRTAAGRARSTTGSAATAGDPAGDTPPSKTETRIVSVALDASVLTDLRNFAVRTEQTHGAVTLRAIEANADVLAQLWDRPRTVDPAAGRLFAGTPALRRRTEPVVQTQIRLVAADTDTLDRLVSDWAAPSRSALVNEALSRYVRPTEQDPS